MIVGVHGIAQQYRGRTQLVASWQPSLVSGVEIAARPQRIGQVPFDLAFYGNQFRKRYARPAGGGLKKGGKDEHVLAGLDQDEVDALLAAAVEVVPSEQLATAEAGAPPKGIPMLPRPLQVVLRALDATFGPSAGVLYLGVLRQVRRYLYDQAVKEEVDVILDDTIGPDCRVLVGHSLGSVVALEFVRRHPEHRLDLLLTLGSPLGLHMVQKGLPVSSYGSTHRAGIPDSVATWVNVRDPRDPVACAGTLQTWWPGVEDRRVDNGWNAHDVSSYLTTTESGSAILTTLPQLRTAPEPAGEGSGTGPGEVR